MSDDTTIHAVGYAHLDPVWLWEWTEGYQEARATFRSALDRMDEFPDYIFTCSQAAVYQWVEENDPAMMEEIARRVREGRWCIVGGWWMEADCNIPSGESFARQGLYGQRYFRQRFGVTAKTGFSADAFGHNAMIPQLIKQAGMDWYLFMRPNRLENPDCPSPAFNWKSADGSTVIAYRLTHSYCSEGDEISLKTMGEIAAWGTEPMRDLMMFFGVGNHGGGPTIRNLESVEKIRASGSSPRLVYGSPDSCFAKLNAARGELPSHSGEWQHHASGCYAAHSELKKLNRRAENALASAEKLSVLASCLAGWGYKGRDFARAWQNVLFCQFHDIMAGTCIREAYDDVGNLFGETLRIAEHELNGAAQRLAAHIDTTGTGIPVIVFNPHSFPVSAAVECDMTRESANGAGGYAMTDSVGNPVACQESVTSAVVEKRHRLCFLATLPAMGYRTYRIHNAGGEIASDGPNEVLSWKKAAAVVHTGYLIHSDGRDSIQVENRWFQMEIDGGRGHINFLRDKRSGVEVFSGEAAVPAVMDDPSDTWSHGIFSFDAQRGRFDDARVRVVEEGPVRIIVRAQSRFGHSTLMQDFILYRDMPRITVRVRADWHETLSMLKISFPVNVAAPVATYEIPYGHIERPSNGEEEPGQNWMDVTGEAQTGGGAACYGLSILNDSLYSSDVCGSVMRITLLRSPVYAHHTPATLVSDGTYAYMDQGEHAFAYELVPHGGPWQDTDTVRDAQVLNAPPFALVEHVHGGSLPAVAEQIRINAPNVVATVLKMKEEADDIILRCYETAGRATEAILEMPFCGRSIELDIGPCEIKTYVIPKDALKPVRETNFLED